MATVPSNAQFRADTTGVTVEQLGSEQTNARAAFFTMADIAESAGPTTNNTAYGLEAFQSNTSGTLNTAIGFQVLKNSTTAGTNVGVGAEALRDNISGGNNIGIGVAALQQLTTGVENTAIGFLSYLFNNESRNTALGAYTGYNSRTNDNTYIGYRSGNESWYGAENTAVGSNAHKSVFNSSASFNVAVGKDALLAISNGSENTAVGYYSQGFNASGNANTSVGYSSMGDGLGGSNNTAIGTVSMFNLDGGNYNIAIGSGSLYEVSTGSFNTIVGGDEFGTQTADGNSGLGYSLNTNDFSNSVLLGREAEASGNNQFVVGSPSYNAGAVATETNTSSKVWNVIINGVSQKILLA